MTNEATQDVGLPSLGEAKRLSPEQMLATDFEQLVMLWESSGLIVHRMKEREHFLVFLAKNPGLSSVIRYKGNVIASILCGFDGMQACLYHIAVNPRYRRVKLGSKLVGRTLSWLMASKVERCALVVRDGNTVGEAFWKSLGWCDYPGKLLLKNLG